MRQSVLARARELLSRRSGGVSALIVLGAIGFFVAENYRPHAPIDDAFIFYRYAENFAAGKGLVYNAGERVEGITSLLWTLLIAVGARLGADAIGFTQWLGVASGALLLVLTYVYAAFGVVRGERVVAALSAWLLLLSKPFAIWSTAGLETPLFAVAVLAALIAHGRGRYRLAVLAAALAVLTRPEGVLIGAVVLSFVLFARDVDRKQKLLLIGAFAGFLAGLTAFRLAYFGAPLPNTFYAKVGGALPWWGRYYLLAYLVHTLLPTLWPSAYVGKKPYFWPGIAWFGCTVLYVAVVGGDAFGNSRFFLPALPVSCAMAVRGALEGYRRHTWSGRLAALSIAVCGLWFGFGTLVGTCALGAAVAISLVPSGWKLRAVLVAAAAPVLTGALIRALRYKPPNFQNNELSQRSLVLGALGVPTRRAELREARVTWRYASFLGFHAARLLEERPPKNKLVAAVGIGALGYYSGARILDMVGLTDPIVARSKVAPTTDMAFPGHQRSNTRYVLSKGPHYIMIPERDPSFFKLPALIELWEDPEFQRSYVFDPGLGAYRRIQ